MKILLLLLLMLCLISLGAMYVGLIVSDNLWGHDIHRQPPWFIKMMEKVTIVLIFSFVGFLLGVFLTWHELSKWQW